MNLLRWARLDQDAVLHHYHPVGQGEGLHLVVGHVNGGEAQVGVEALDLGPHLDPQLGVQVRERLVQEHETRVQDQRPRNGNPLLLSARELPGIPILEARELDQLQHFLHAPPDLLGRPALELQAEGDVAEDGHVRKQRVVLEDHPEAALLGRHAVDALPVDRDLTVGGGDQSRDDVQGRGLAAPAGPQEGDELLAPNLEGEIPQHGLRPEALGNPELQRINRLFHVLPPMREEGERPRVGRSPSESNRGLRATAS